MRWQVHAALTLFGLGFAAAGAYAAECESLTGLEKYQSEALVIGSAAQTVQVFAPQKHGPMAGEENVCVVRILDEPAKSCLADFRGFRKLGETRVPYFQTRIQGFTLGPGQSAVQVDSRYSHGYTEVLSAVIYRDAKGKFHMSPALPTLQVAPDGREFKTPLQAKDINGDGHLDLMAGKRAALFEPATGLFVLPKASRQKR